ncbi:C-type lectin domain family 4 member M-like [Xiphias gladius]|uniref:C-type lectin domain family 4 member M-like n=1 Tax=Xiphias gladius TaxID=8245 RepID=UPI001A98DA7B|nr:C-type lectin domain family 4 member M-like [Xiphias gladius]
MPSYSLLPFQNQEHLQTSPPNKKNSEATIRMDSMEIDDDIYIRKNLTMEGLVPQVDLQRRKKMCRCATVCLGLLCVVLLAGNIGQITYYELLHRLSSADQTQASYNALTEETDRLQNHSDILTTERDQLQSDRDSLSAERKQLEARLSNLTKEKDQLQQSYNSLSTERDEFKASFNNVENVRDLLQASYNTLKQNSDQLLTSYNDVKRNLKGLETRFSTLTANIDQLRSNYSSLKKDKDQLQSSYSTLSMGKNHLQISYNSLWKEKEQLKSRYNALWREKEWLQTNYSSLATGRDQSQKKADKMTVKVRDMLCQTGWKKFDLSCYFTSTLKKNWTESRKACVAQGADLVVIDSRDEQVFANGLLQSGQNAWIGLTDSLKEGTWMWVDGTPVTIEFWQPGQPNSFNGNQDCGEMVQKSTGAVGEWNDDGCFAEQLWICEK